MDETGQSLIEAHCQGCPTAFTEIVRRYGGNVMGHLLQVCGTQEQAEDCFQETFKRVHQKAHTFRGPRLKPWLLTIATRVGLNGLRKDRRRNFVSLDGRNNCANDGSGECGGLAIADDSPGPSEQSANSEQKQHVRQVIGSLPPKQRATLVLAYYQELSYPEVAQIMGCSLGTVKTQMYRALRELARKLPDPGGETR